MNNFYELIKQSGRICISGHIRPDGDCIGACTAVYNYISENFKEDNKKIDVYVESISDSFMFLSGIDKFILTYPDVERYDLFISLDCGSIDRLGEAQKYFIQSSKTICIDHHISNTKYGDINIVEPDASSTCELLYTLFDKDKISFNTAEPLYLGIVHDTGVFKHSNTKRRTMEIAGALIEKGISPSKIIDGTFYEKTHLQNQILGRCLLESFTVLNGKIIISYVTKKTQDFYCTTHFDFEGVIDQLRITKGVEVALFLIEEKTGTYKVSMRSNGIVDVSKIAVFFGGGGHVKAAGCSIDGRLHDIINNITIGIEHQLLE